jgi:spermidine synthase
MSHLAGTWYLTPDSYNSPNLFPVGELLLGKRTKFQRMEILRSPVLGLCLVLDGLVQVAEADEHRYHETLVHPALLNVEEPRDVAIVGGGDGCALREVLKHKAVERVDLVDLDRDVVEASKKYLSRVNKRSLSSPKVRLHFADGRKFLSKRREVYDAILLDATDPTEGGPSLLLYSREFYSIVRSALRPGGAVVTQATALESYQFRRIFWTVRSVFGHAEALHAFVRSFYDDWGFVMSTRSKEIRLKPRDPELVDGELKRRIRGELRYLDGSIYCSSFAIPPELRDRLMRPAPIIRDREALAAQRPATGERHPSPWAFERAKAKGSRS